MLYSDSDEKIGTRSQEAWLAGGWKLSHQIGDDVKEWLLVSPFTNVPKLVLAFQRDLPALHHIPKIHQESETEAWSYIGDSEAASRWQGNMFAVLCVVSTVSVSTLLNSGSHNVHGLSTVASRWTLVLKTNVCVIGQSIWNQGEPLHSANISVSQTRMSWSVFNDCTVNT